MLAIQICILALTVLGEWEALQCKGETVSGRYYNYALGYSIGIPKNLQGRRGQSSGPERGISIPLTANCSSVIAISSDPNSLEWPTPADAIGWEIQNNATDPDKEIVRYGTHLGKLKAAGLILRNRKTTRVENIVIAFGPDSGLVYIARLVTTQAREKQDSERFKKVLGGFKIEPWR
jgi:hypothetical protein